MKESNGIEGRIAALCLEQTQVIHHYFAMTKKQKKHGNIATFCFDDFPCVDDNLNFQVADLYTVDIDSDTKSVVEAKLYDSDLTASETLILLAFNAVSAQHVKIHAMANWGTNDHPSLKKANPFLRRNSIVTNMYNYFGYSSFHGLVGNVGETGSSLERLEWDRCFDQVFRSRHQRWYLSSWKYF